MFGQKRQQPRQRGRNTRLMSISTKFPEFTASHCTHPWKELTKVRSQNIRQGNRGPKHAGNKQSKRKRSKRSMGWEQSRALTSALAVAFPQFLLPSSPDASCWPWLVVGWWRAGGPCRPSLPAPKLELNCSSESKSKSRGWLLRYIYYTR